MLRWNKAPGEFILLVFFFVQKYSSFAPNLYVLIFATLFALANFTAAAPCNGMQNAIYPVFNTGASSFSQMVATLAH